MNLSETILKTGHLTAPSVPELRYLAAAAQKVRDRWPDVDPPKNEQEREALALKLRDKVEGGAWDKTRLSFVIAAASAVFDPERRDRPDLSRTRDFLYAEVGASTRGADPLEIVELKKRKLAVKEELQAIERA